MDFDRKLSRKIRRDHSMTPKNNHNQKINLNNINNSQIIRKRHQEKKDSKKSIQEIKLKTKNKNENQLKTESTKKTKNIFKKKELNNTKNDSSLMEQNKNKKLVNKNEIKKNIQNIIYDKQKKNGINKLKEIKKDNEVKKVNKENKIDEEKKVNKDKKKQKNGKSEVKENEFQKDMIVIKDIEQKNNSLIQENKNLLNQIIKEKDERIKNLEQQNLYENKIKNLNLQIESLKKENNDLIFKYENKINLLKDEINSLKKDNNDLTSRNGELEKVMISLQTQIKKLNKIIIKIKKVNPFILYSSPTLIGLNNIGQTCFMNSTLQCLSQTKELAYYFLKEDNKDKIINNNIALENKNNYQLSPIYLKLIQKLWEIDGPKSFSPKTFMNTVEKMNPLFKQGQVGDAKDFIIFILEQLHKELKKSNNITNSNENQSLNQYDKNSAFNYFFNDFKKEGSIISDLFFGFNETTNECLNCKNIYNSQNLINPICYNYGIFNCLIFPLEEVKNWKNNQMQYNNIQINNNTVSLYDCFSYNQKGDYFTGENRNYCNICKQLFDSIYISKIFISPKILVIILNRGRGNIYNVKLDFNEIIDITQFVLQKECPNLIYSLYGVITHIGGSGPNSHYAAHVKVQ